MHRKIKNYFKEIIITILSKSIDSAAREQGLSKFIGDLEKIVPDITDQYSTFKLDSNYLKKKVRSVHAFQMSLVDKAIKGIKNPVVVDIGDSAGTHIQYIKRMYPENGDIHCLSVNLDPEAVSKIQQKGLEAVFARAEELVQHHIKADIFLCFEVLEHIFDPALFLYNLSQKTHARYLVITVPYVKRSRVGLYHIRKGEEKKVYAENTHMYEFSPEDWKLVAKHSGWSIFYEQVYFQYPKFNPLRMTKSIWKRFDFEGFYGLILEKNDKWSSKYMDWSV